MAGGNPELLPLMPYRRPANLGQRCRKWKRVRGVLRCKAFTYPRRMFQMGFRRGHVPANYGAVCLRRKRVYSPWFNKKVWRCAKYGPGRGGPPRPRRGALLLPPPRTRPPAGVFGPPGYIPLSLPSMERQSSGRTPL